MNLELFSISKRIELAIPITSRDQVQNSIHAEIEKSRRFMCNTNAYQKCRTLLKCARALYVSFSQPWLLGWMRSLLSFYVFPIQMLAMWKIHVWSTYHK